MQLCSRPIRRWGPTPKMSAASRPRFGQCRTHERWSSDDARSRKREGLVGRNLSRRARPLLRPGDRRHRHAGDADAGDRHHHADDVADIGGADYYTWAAMLYTIG